MKAADGFGITCKCGHSDDWDNFEKSPMGLPLEKGTYQCPACHVAWTIKFVGSAQYFDDGFVIPKDKKIVEVNGML